MQANVGEVFTVKLGDGHSQVVILHCDNRVAMHIVMNTMFYKRTKHIELDFICENDP